MAKIFVQIAAYRDPELVPTIRDCLEKARYPNELTFGICWQRDDEEESPVPAGTSRFRIDEVAWQQSEGLGWARNRIGQLYDGEEFTLQLDSHHRFARHWDAALLAMAEKTGSTKPMISTYATAYRPSRHGIRSLEAMDPRLYAMVADEFTTAGTVLFRPRHVRRGGSPLPARFVSGHFYFTIGRHCEEYSYDPRIYFAGDEISLSLRSFTLGYDLFRPNRTLVWHEYTRKGRRKHWDDHTTARRREGEVALAWHDRNKLSMQRLAQLLGQRDWGIDLGTSGIGCARTRREYELYAGIDFKNRRLHPYTLAGHDPPNPSDRGWEAGYSD